MLMGTWNLDLETLPLLSNPSDSNGEAKCRESRGQCQGKPLSAPGPYSLSGWPPPVLMGQGDRGQDADFISSWPMLPQWEKQAKQSFH